ncbi:hypothetical protein Tco_0097506 [Tanacetum coccineum]
MNPLVVQQCALDDTLVAPDNRAIIGKCNMRIEPTKTHKEVTIRNQEFVEPPNHEEIVAFIKELGYRGELKSFTEMHIDHMSQPWRTFASIINRCLFGKVTAFDQLRLSMAQILWDKTISMRNNLFMHGAMNDSVLGFMKFISKYKIRQMYGKLILDVLVSREKLESKTYKTYLDYATRKVIPKEARKRTKDHMKETSLIVDDNIIPDDPDAALKLAKSISKTEAEEQEAARLVHETYLRLLKGTEILSDATILEEDTRKENKASKHDLRSQHQTGGSSEGAGSKPKVPDESKGKTKHTNEGASSKPEGDSEDDDRKSDDERTKSDDDKSIDLNKINDEEEDQGDESVHTPNDYVPTNDETQDVDDEEYNLINKELYNDVNVEMKDVEPGDEKLTDTKHVDVEHVEINQEVASAKVQDEVQATTTAAPAT